jgi:hypothetical protein
VNHSRYILQDRNRLSAVFKLHRHFSMRVVEHYVEKMLLNIPS